MAESRAAEERQLREMAEARIRELEEQLRQIQPLTIADNGRERLSVLVLPSGMLPHPYTGR